MIPIHENIWQTVEPNANDLRPSKLIFTTLNYSLVLHSTRYYSMLLYTTLYCSTHHSIFLYTSLFYSQLLYTTRTLYYSMLFYTHSILLHTPLYHSIPLYSTLYCSILILYYPTPFTTLYAILCTVHSLPYHFIDAAGKQILIEHYQIAQHVGLLLRVNKFVALQK